MSIASASFLVATDMLTLLLSRHDGLGRVLTVEARLARLAVVVVTSQHLQSGKRTHLPRSFLHFHRHLLPAPGTLLRIVVLLAPATLQPPRQAGALQRLGLGFQRQLQDRKSVV